MSFQTIIPLNSLADIEANYKAILCDVWGVVHNGIMAWQNACEALIHFREATGGAVILITNAPRPASAVIDQIDELNVPKAAYDNIITSGDATQRLLEFSSYQRLYHLGPKKDLPLLQGLNKDFVQLDEAEMIICSGLFNEFEETPEDYRPQFETAIEMELELICANPDLVYERGDTLYYCAGALAQLYSEMGGVVQIIGKPHPPIYHEAEKMIREVLGQKIETNEILAIGDSLTTDMPGALKMGYGSLFISGGIHAHKLGDREKPDLERLDQLVRQAGLENVYTQPFLI